MFFLQKRALEKSSTLFAINMSKSCILFGIFDNFFGKKNVFIFMVKEQNNILNTSMVWNDFKFGKCLKQNVFAVAHERSCSNRVKRRHN